MNSAKVPEMDQLLEKAKVLFDEEERAAVFQQVIQLDYDNAYRIWVQEAPTIAAHHRSIRGLRWMHIGSAINLVGAWRA